MRTLLLALPLMLVSAGAQAKGTCSNPGVAWSVSQSSVDATPAAIQGDGAPYVNGQAGVTAVINVCSGSYDATLLLGQRRFLSFTFADLLASNAYTPSWALSGNTVTGAGFLNIRNLWFVPAGFTRDDEYTFSTWMGANVPIGGSLGFDMLNPAPDPPLSGPNLAKANAPYPNSRVVAHHCPANTNTVTCPNVVAESWFVYPESDPTAGGLSPTGLPIANVGVLFQTSKGTTVNAGEFSMPFLFVISMTD